MILSDSDGSSGAGGLSQQEIDVIVKQKVEARFAEQVAAQEQWRRQYEQQFQSQMANLSGALMSYMQNLRSTNHSIALPAFSFSSPTPNLFNATLGGDSTEIRMDDLLAELQGNPVV
ncbi:unnamed protein product [Cuscuta europaea]|uniref:Uncharacterized protein n=1 Tax=Cuscuta europaea TaxID=41803 RepID=A0A9P0YIE6_CUSEU|nr:unnamed protein product [Cuscuta europaea]